MREAARAREVRESATAALHRRLDGALADDPGWAGVAEGDIEAEHADSTPPAAKGVEAPARRSTPLSLARFTPRHFAVVAVIALAGCVWAGFSLLSARTVAVPVIQAAASTGSPSVAGSTPGAASAAATHSASASPTPTILVHVLGAVRKPGLVHLPKGARVADAIDAAGGLRSDARPGQLNLAAVVADGSQVFIGTPGTPGGELRGQGAASGGSSAAEDGAASPVNLNTATAEQLEALPGVGPVTAQAILDWRSQHTFARVEQLQEVDGIGPKTYAKLAPLVTV